MSTKLHSVGGHRALESRIALVLAGIFFVALAVIAALPVFSHESWMIFVQDDLLYYLKVAQNIVQGHGSTFNGIVPTNGYQPLWLLLLMMLSFVTSAPKAILAALAIVSWVAAGVTFLLARKLLRRSGARPLLVLALAGWVTIYSMTLFFYGMEVTLTVPVILGVLCLLTDIEWLTAGPWHTFLFGLLLSCMVLSRIDTLILGGLLLAGILLTPSLRALLRPRLVGGLALGLTPVAGYFVMNHVVFGTWLPVSGMAKELKGNHLPSIEPWRVFFHPLAGGFTVVLLGAMLLLPKLRERITPMERVMFPAVLAFPFLYYFILSCVSDWTLWGWYMYPIRTALCVAFLIFCLYPPVSQMLNRPLVTGALLLTLFATLAVLRWTKQQADIYEASVEIAEFARSHPGTYAMGDRAGRVAMLIPDPIVQTEGLMMDREYLRNVERQLPLRDVLGRYGVRYYIGTAYEPFTGCFEAAEPAKAGPSSAHMRAEFCEPPLATYLHNGVETLVYDLQRPK